jgi:cyanate lyase
MDKQQIYEVRATNLDKAIGNPGKHGRVAEFSRKYNLNPAYVSHLLNGRKNLGEDLARQYEEMLELPKYALDKDESDKDKLLESLPSDQKELVERFMASSQEIQEAVLKVLAPLPDKKT